LIDGVPILRLEARNTVVTKGQTNMVAVKNTVSMAGKVEENITKEFPIKMS